MGKALVAMLGGGVLIPILGATVRHYWTKYLQRKDNENG